MGRRYRLLDLFAGCGGLSLGFNRTGRFRAIGAVEIDRDAASTYRANFGQHMYQGDIADWLNQESLPEADVVVGGPPCQGFSNLGLRRTNDPRNGLWRQHARAINRIRPRVFVMENVPDFLRSAQFRSMIAETGRGGLLEEYDISSEVLDASQYGAAQRRRRALVIGRRRDQPGLGFPSPTTVDAPVTVRTVLLGVPRRVTKVALPREEGPYSSRELHLTRRFEEISLRRFAAIPEGGNRFDIHPDDLAPCWRNHRSGSGDVMGRLRWDQPSVTIRTEFYKPEKGRYLHPTENRPITHYEAALIQGFPLDFKWFGSKTSIGRQIGNAVPIPLGQAVAMHLAHWLDTAAHSQDRSSVSEHPQPEVA